MTSFAALLTDISVEYPVDVSKCSDTSVSTVTVMFGK